MKKSKKALTLLLLGFGIVTIQAQQAITATGSSTSSSGGAVSYSVGQIVYLTNSNSNFSVMQGVQQPFEISVILGIENSLIDLQIQTYPNPTTDYLTLNIEHVKLQDLNYQLLDISGKIIEVKKIANTTETIRMGHLSSAIYFLKIVTGNKELKTFKIIKN